MGQFSVGVNTRFQPAASSLRFQLRVVGVKSADDLERAFLYMARSGVEVLIVPPMSLLLINGTRINELAMKARLPIFSTAGSPDDGNLLTYSSDLRDNARRVAVFVDKIFKGATPANLPIEQPDRFALAINLRVANALGITIPQSIVARADEVIR